MRTLAMASGTSARSRPMVRHQPQLRLDCSAATRPFSTTVTATPFSAKASAVLIPATPPPITTTPVRLGSSASVSVVSSK